MSSRGSYAKGIAKREEILTIALDLVARNGYSRATVRELADAVGLSQAGLLHHFGTKEELFTEILRRRDEVDRREFAEGAGAGQVDGGRDGEGASAVGAAAAGAGAVGAGSAGAGAAESSGAGAAGAGVAAGAAGGAGGDGGGFDVADAYVRLVRHNARVPGLVQLYSRFSVEAAEPGHPSHEFFRERFESLRVTTAAALRRLQEQGRLPAQADPDKVAVLVAALSDGLQISWLYDPDLDMADHVAHFWELIRHDAATGRDG